MKKIWWILTVLTLARTAMGFQFQSLAVMGPTLITNSNLSYIELGTLIGIYLLPGILFAIPGGWLGKRFGDKPVVVTGLVMMTIGGSLLALADSYHHMFLGRLLSGLGAVLLNVLMTKMVTDWFAEHRLSVAMGIFITSWPLGISIALLTIGPLESMIGPEMIFFVPAILCASVLVLVATIYSNPPQSIEAEKTSIDSSKSKLTGYEFSGVVMCGLVWSLYNVALILLLSFGPEFLIAQGVTPITSGAIVSLTSWLIIPALPLGAWIAERTGNPFTTMGVTFITIAILSWMIPFT
ncbi:MAG: MFS family permease, partial [Gammaproteobacteria bacterium]